MDGEIAKQEIAIKLEQQVVSGQLKKIVRDLLQEGVIEQMLPEKPNSRMQKFRLTSFGNAQLFNKNGARK